jgi:hypothetical protein
MDWIQDNWQVAGCIAAAVAWLVQMLGPAAVNQLKEEIAAAGPKLKGKTTLKNLWPLLVGVLLLGSMVLPRLAPVTPVEPARVPDIVDQCSASGRALLADALVEFAGQKFETVQAQEDAINEKIGDVIEASFAPVNDQIAKAIKDDRLTDCAELIRKGDLRE